MEHTTALLLLALASSSWFGAGLVDWRCHHASGIETTTGLPEASLHLAQAATVAVALSVGLFVSVTRGSFAVMVVAVFAHTALALIDTTYSAPRRRISVTEQHAHGVLEVVPLAALAVFGAYHVDVLRAGAAPLTWRTPSAAGALLILLPATLCGLALLEETRRCWRRRHAASSN